MECSARIKYPRSYKMLTRTTGYFINILMEDISWSWHAELIIKCSWLVPVAAEMTGDSVKIWGSLGTSLCKSKSFKNSAKKSAIFKKWNSFLICLKTVFYTCFKYLMKYWERKIYFSQCHVNGNVDNGLSLTHLVSQFILGRLSAIQPIAIKLWRQPKLYYNLNSTDAKR